MSILNDRATHYGGEADNYANLRCIAALWSAYTGTTLTAGDVCWMMVMVKASRAKVDPDHLDNYLDGAGYAQLAERVRHL